MSYLQGSSPVVPEILSMYRCGSDCPLRKGSVGTVGMRCSRCNNQAITIALNWKLHACTEDELSTDTENFSAEGPKRYGNRGGTFDSLMEVKGTWAV